VNNQLHEAFKLGAPIQPNDYVASFVGLSHHGVSITHGHHNQKGKNETRRKCIVSIMIHKMPIKNYM